MKYIQIKMFIAFSLEMLKWLKIYFCLDSNKNKCNLQKQEQIS